MTDGIDQYLLQSACVTELLLSGRPHERCHCAMCAENECEETLSRRSAKFTGPLVLAKEHDVRLPWTVTTECVHQKQTTALLVCYYFIILLVIFNTFKVHL